MPTSKSTRRARHQQAETPTLDRGNPSASEGRVGTQQFRNIPGKGLVHLVRDETGWKEMGTSQSNTNQGDTIPTSVSVASGVSSSSSSSSSGGSTTIGTNAIENFMMADDSVSTAEIVNNSVTYGKLQQINTDTFLGRDTAGTGNVEEITLSQLETMLQLNQYLSVASTNTLTDVTVNNSTVTTGHYLRHNGTNFVNTTFNAADISGLQASQIPVIDISSKTTGTLPVNRGGTGATSGYNSSNWNTAYGWGDHGAAGYMSSFIITETDAGTSTVNNGKYVKFASSNSGSHGNSTVTGSGSSGDPFVVTLNTPDTNTFQQTTFTLTADSGSNQTIAHGNTLDIEGGTGVSTAVGSTDKVTVSIGQSIGTSNSPTFAGLTLSSLSSQSSEATAVMINGSNVIGKRELGSAAFASTGDFKGASAVVSVATGGTGQDNVTAFKNVLDDETWTFANATTFSSTITSGGHLITGVSNYNGLEVKGGGGSRPQIQWSNVNNGDLGVIYATEGQALIIGTGNSNTTAITIDSSQVCLFASTIRGSADVVAYYSSDPILKENKKLIENPLDKISQLGGYSFDWKEEAKDMVGDHLNGKDYGVMADEVQALFPELVNVRSNGIRAVKYDKLVPLLIEGIKELKKELTIIKERL